MNLQWKTTGTGVTTQVFTLAPISPWTSTPVTINAINPPNAPLSSSPTTFQLSVSFTNGWNMVSIPGLHPEIRMFLPGGHEKIRRRMFSIMQVDIQQYATVTPGTGYWMKHSGAEHIFHR